MNGYWNYGLFNDGEVVKVVPRYPAKDDTSFEVGIIVGGFEIPEEPEERLAEWRYEILIDGIVRTVKERQVRFLDKQP